MDLAWYEQKSQPYPSQNIRCWMNYYLSNHTWLICKMETIILFTGVWEDYIERMELFFWNYRSNSFFAKEIYSKFCRHLMPKVAPSFIDRALVAGSEGGVSGLHQSNVFNQHVRWELPLVVLVTWGNSLGWTLLFFTLWIIFCLVSMCVYAFFLGKYWFFLLDY